MLFILFKQSCCVLFPNDIQIITSDKRNKYVMVKKLIDLPRNNKPITTNKSKNFCQIELT